MNIICNSKCSVVTKTLLLTVIFWGLIVNSKIRAEADDELQELMQQYCIILQPVSPDEIQWDIVVDTIDSVIIDPQNSKIIYAITSRGILRSVDSGENWRLLDNGNILIGNIGILTIDPNNTSIMYASAYIIVDGKGIGGIIKSKDSGFNWQLLMKLELAWEYRHISSILVDPNNSSIIYITNRDNIYKSTDAGLNWEIIVSESSSGPILSIGRESSILYASFTGRTSSRILKSEDDGKSWMEIDDGFEYTEEHKLTYVKSIAISQHNKNVIYAVLSRRLYKSNDGGKSWKELEKSPYKTGNASHNNIILTNNQNIIYLVTGNALYRSTNGGKSWKKTHRDEKNRIRTDFIAVDPKNHKIIFAGNNERLYKSINSGRTWKTILGRPLKFEE